MNRLGHLGLALLVSAGLSALLGLSLFPALWVCACAAAFSVVPDRLEFEKAARDLGVGARRVNEVLVA